MLLDVTTPSWMVVSGFDIFLAKSHLVRVRERLHFAYLVLLPQKQPGLIETNQWFHTKSISNSGLLLDSLLAKNHLDRVRKRSCSAHLVLSPQIWLKNVLPSCHSVVSHLQMLSSGLSLDSLLSQQRCFCLQKRGWKILWYFNKKYPVLSHKWTAVSGFTASLQTLVTVMKWSCFGSPCSVATNDAVPVLSCIQMLRFHLVQWSLDWQPSCRAQTLQPSAHIHELWTCNMTWYTEYIWMYPWFAEK